MFQYGLKKILKKWLVKPFFYVIIMSVPKEGGNIMGQTLENRIIDIDTHRHDDPYYVGYKMLTKCLETDIFYDGMSQSATMLPQIIFHLVNRL